MCEQRYALLDMNISKYGWRPLHVFQDGHPMSSALTQQSCCYGSLA